MHTALTDFLTAVGFGTVCLGTIAGFVFLTAVIDGWLTERKLMKMKKMEQRINEKV